LETEEEKEDLEKVGEDFHPDMEMKVLDYF